MPKRAARVPVRSARGRKNLLPSQYTHQLIAEEVFARLPENVRAAIPSKAAYFLGAQGGDIYFFFRVKDGRRRNLGKRMHNRRIYEDLSAFAAAAGEADEVSSYAAGYLCHYAADTVFHPFVYGLTERFLAEEPSRRVKWHAYIESDLDTHFVSARLGLPVQSYSFPLRRKDVDLDALYPLVHAVCGGTEGHKLFSPRAFRAAVGRFFLYVWWFRDPHLRRRRFFEGAERLLHVPHVLSALYRRAQADERCLNADGREWRNPSVPAFFSCEDADRLFERAVAEGVRLLCEFFICVRGGVPLPREDFGKNFLSGAPEGVPVVRPERRREKPSGDAQAEK